MSVTVYRVYEADISQLISRYKPFKLLESARISAKDKNQWIWNAEKNGKAVSWKYYQSSVIFIGKSGYGKSTTLNRIVGKDVFQTNDIEACTKDLYCAVYHMKHDNDCFALCDLPGVGESMQADEQYMKWYREMLSCSCCVVYVLRADQRDYSVDGKIFKNLFKSKNARNKVILALNYADKIEPVSRSEIISSQQRANLNSKVSKIKKLFGIDNVMYYSAVNDVNVDKLISKISDMVKSDVKADNTVKAKSDNSSYDDIFGIFKR